MPMRTAVGLAIPSSQPLTELIGVAVVGFVVLVLAMPRDLNIFDEGIIFSGAMRVLNGDVIHRDFYSLYGPAQFYAVAGTMKLSGNGFLAARLYDLAIRTAIVAAAFAIIRRQCALPTALLFAALGGIWMLAIGNYLFPIFPCILLSLMGSCLVARSAATAAPLPALAGAGACAGAAALFRYETGFFLLLANVSSIVALAWLMRPHGTWFRRSAMGVAAYGAGTALVFLPFATAFLLIAPLSAFKADVINYPVTYYAAMRGLPFPPLWRIRADAVYLPLLAAGLAAAELLWLWVCKAAAPLQTDLSTACLVVFGTAAAVLFLKGVVRVSPIHMLTGIMPGLIVLAILVEFWWRRGYALRAVAVVAALVTAAPAAVEAESLFRSLWSVPDRSVAGWLMAPLHPDRCETAPASGFARLSPDYARVATYLAAHSRPDERIVIALDRHDKVFVNPVSLYFAAGRLPGTHWHEFDPGLQTRADIQQAIIADLQRNGVRWVVRDASFDGVREPNGSANSSGVKLLDAYLDEHYRAVAASGHIAIWLRIGEEPGLAQPGPCEAAPVRS